MGAALLSLKTPISLLRCLCPAVDGALRVSFLRSPLHHEPVAELERKQGLFRREGRSSLDKSRSWAGGPACSWEIPEPSGRLGAQHCSWGTTDLTPMKTSHHFTKRCCRRAQWPRGARAGTSGLCHPWPVWHQLLGRHWMPACLGWSRALAYWLARDLRRPWPPGASDPDPVEPCTPWSCLLCVTLWVGDEASFTARGRVRRTGPYLVVHKCHHLLSPSC